MQSNSYYAIFEKMMIPYHDRLMTVLLLYPSQLFLYIH